MSNDLYTHNERPGVGRYALTITCGIAATLALGAIATLLRREDAVFFGVFAAVLAGPCISLAWALIITRRTPVRDRYAQDNAETRWITAATSGACLDIVTASGIGLAALAITGTDVSGMAILAGVIVLAIVDTAVRYAVARRRES